MCAPLAGIGYQIEYLADVRVLFDYFYPEILPFGVLDVPDSAHEQWDGPNGFKEKIAVAEAQRRAGELLQHEIRNVGPLGSLPL